MRRTLSPCRFWQGNYSNAFIERTGSRTFRPGGNTTNRLQSSPTSRQADISTGLRLCSLVFHSTCCEGNSWRKLSNCELVCDTSAPRILGFHVWSTGNTPHCGVFRVVQYEESSAAKGRTVCPSSSSTCANRWELISHKYIILYTFFAPIKAQGAYCTPSSPCLTPIWHHLIEPFHRLVGSRIGTPTSCVILQRIIHKPTGWQKVQSLDVPEQEEEGLGIAASDALLLPMGRHYPPCCQSLDF